MPTPALRTAWPLPGNPRPIVLIGAGGIVNDAHLPAYRKAGLRVAGVYDVNATRAAETAAKWGIGKVHGTLGEAFAVAGAVFDIAVPPEHLFGIVALAPGASTLLLQKPMGVDLADARRIRDVCREKGHVAAVNFQLRFAPVTLAAKDLLDRGALGTLTDLSFHFNLRTPWELFPFLLKLKRCEILVHTIHHLDLCRHLLGDPTGVWAQTLKHPSHAGLASTRTTAILKYGEMLRCALSINHNFEFGPEDECADLRIQGTAGALRISLGLLLNYPHGKPETLAFRTAGMNAWEHVPIEGKWFPDAFIGTMSNLQRFAAGEDAGLVTRVDDAYRTMALVEACYDSSAAGATAIPE